MLIAIGASFLVAYGCIFALMRASAAADAVVAKWPVEYEERAS